MSTDLPPLGFAAAAPASAADVQRHTLARRVADRIAADDWFADVTAGLLRLAEWRDDPEPGPPPRVSTASLRHLNARLRDRQDRAAERAALTTVQVQDLLAGVNTRASVHARLDRGKLLAFKSRTGNANRFPAWQFDDPHRAATVPVVADLVRVCRDRFDGDVVAFDLMVRTRQDRLGGRSVADLLAEGRWDEAVAAADTAPEQAG